MERSLRVGGLNVRYLEHGEGAPVILLHGASLGSSADVWTRNLPALAAYRLRVIAPDLPGFGGSNNRRTPPSAIAGASFLRSWTLWTSRVPRSSATRNRGASRSISPSTHRSVSRKSSCSAPAAAAAARGRFEPAAEGRKAPLPSRPSTSRGACSNRTLSSPSCDQDAVALRHRMSLGKEREAFAARRHSRSAKTDKSGEAPAENSPGARCRWLLYGENDRGEAARRGPRAGAQPAARPAAFAALRHPSSGRGRRVRRARRTISGGGLAPTRWVILPHRFARRFPPVGWRGHPSACYTIASRKECRRCPRPSSPQDSS